MVKISLPNPNDFHDKPEQYFRQLELAIHHARKSYEELKNSDDISEDFYITYRHPEIDLHNQELDDESFVKIHVDQENEGMQNIEIELNF